MESCRRRRRREVRRHVALLAQFVSLTTHPGGREVPAALRYLLAPHQLEHSQATTAAHCPYEPFCGTGDRRPALTEPQDGWRRLVADRHARRTQLRLRPAVLAQRLLHRLTRRI